MVKFLRSPLELFYYLLLLSNSAYASFDQEQFYSREKLATDILQLTGAERDVRLEVIYQIEKVIIPSLKDPQEFENDWKCVKKDFITDNDNLRPPEDLVCLQPYREARKAFLPLSENDIFKNFNKVLILLDKFKNSIVSGTEDVNHKKIIGSLLEDLNNFYESHKQKFRESFEFPDFFYDLAEPKSIMMGDLWGENSFFRISQRMAHFLIKKDENGEKIADDSLATKNHPISFLPYEGEKKVYFKQNGHPSLNPSREFMLTNLYHHLGIAAPASGLLILDNIRFGGVHNKEPFILQASQAIQGLAGHLFYTFDINKFIFDQEHFSRQVIGTLLTSPSDQKPDNFVVVPIGKKWCWVGIDNDEVFVDPFNKNIIHLKSILLTLPNMDQVVGPATQSFFECIDSDIIFLKWLNDLSNQNAHYLSLNQRAVFYRSLLKKRHFDHLEKKFKDLWNDLSLPFLSFNESILPTVKQIMETIQYELRNTRGVTLQQLFDVCYPWIASHYKKFKKQHDNILNYGSIDKKLMNEDKLNIRLGSFEILKKKKYYISDNYSIDSSSSSSSAEMPLYHTPSSKKLFQEYKKDWLDNLHIQKEEFFLDEVISSFMHRLRKNKELLQEVINDISSTFKLLIEYNFVKIKNTEAAVQLWWEIQKKEIKESNDSFEKLSTFNPELNWLLHLEKNFLMSWPHEERFPQTFREIKGSRCGERSLPPFIVDVLFDENGKFKRNPTLSGRSKVANYPLHEPIFYFKKYPEFSGYEYAATDFMRRLGISNIPYNELFLFSDPRKGHYPVLVSEAIQGEPVYKIWDDDANFSKLDPHHTGLLILASMLLNPEDAKEDNFILSHDKRYLIPIDNDHIFLPGAIHKEGSFFTMFTICESLQSKTLLFSLREMNIQLEDSVINNIISINVNQFLRDWMRNLVFVDELLQTLFDQEKIPQLWNRKGVCLKIPLSEFYLRNLYYKFNEMQALLKQNRSLKPLDILLKLEPYVGGKYKEGFEKNILTLKSRFEYVTNRLYPEKKGSALSKPPLSSSQYLEAPRVSAIDSKRMMEIINVPPEEIVGDIMHAKQGPISRIELIENLIHEREILQASLTHSRDKEIENYCVYSGLTEQQENQAINEILSNNCPREVLIIQGSKTFNPSFLKNLSLLENGKRLKFLDLRGARKGNDELFKLISDTFPFLEYLNVSEWPNLTTINFSQIQGTLPLLKRLVINNDPKLVRINIEGPSLIILQAQENRILKELRPVLLSLQSLDITGHNFLMVKIKDIIKNMPQNSILKALPGVSSVLDTDAQYRLGWMYQKGLGAPQNYNEAIEWYRKAANQRHAKAQYRLGWMYQNELGISKNDHEAFKWYQQAANQGRAKAQYYIGRMYQNGLGVSKNDHEAFKWYQQAANQGRAKAQYYIGRMYQNGLGISKNDHEAFRWYQQAANQGHAKAQNNLGGMYQNGLGVSKNDHEAFKWYQRAAEQDYPNAQCNLGWMYQNGLGGLQSNSEAFKWYEKAAQQNHMVSQNNLGWMYQNGLGVLQNRHEAIEWYKKAAEQDYSGSQYNLGWMYEKGLGAPQNYNEAIEWYRKAAEQSHIEAQYRLGIMYKEGYGVSQDFIEAIKWFQKAFRQGHAESKVYLNWIYENEQGFSQEIIRDLGRYEHVDGGSNILLKLLNGISLLNK